MCVNCVTGAEVMVVQGVTAVAVARAGLGRLRERLAGRGAGERRLEAYRANAEFLESMDLDPARVLGPPPRPSAAPSPAKLARPHPAPTRAAAMSAAGTGA